MKPILAPSIRLAAVASTLFLLSLSASAKDTADADRASQLLAGRGSIPVHAAGPYVEVGTYRIQVSVKLGQPTVRLSHDTWLYENIRVDDSSARGTLIVRFEQGRVSSLSLATPTYVAALRNPRDQGNGTAIVSSDRP